VRYITYTVHNKTTILPTSGLQHYQLPQQCWLHWWHPQNTATHTHLSQKKANTEAVTWALPTPKFNPQQNIRAVVKKAKWNPLCCTLLCKNCWIMIIYTECPRRNGRNFGRVFLILKYTDITQNTYIQSWTVTEIMAIEKCGLLECPRTVRRPWRHTHTLRMPGNEKPLGNIGMQWPWRDNGQLRHA